MHLQSEEPAITAGFLRFPQGEARQADALYILGDLSEAWIGDDDPNSLYQQIVSAIKAVVDASVPCYFIHGNRDLLIGQRFVRQSGMLLLTEEGRLDLYGREVLIMHGNTLCTDDPGHLVLRAKVHILQTQRLFLAPPLLIRRRIAVRMHADSKAANSSKLMDIMDVSPQAVVDVMERHHMQWLIHGRTHRPVVHELQINGQSAWCVVFGVWHSRDSMVKVTPDDIELIHFPFQFLREHNSESTFCPGKGARFPASCTLISHDITLKERA